MDIHALPHWHTIDFISDLHLQSDMPATFSAWHNYLQCTPANALFILGDLFEVWIGDDVLNNPHSFEARCTRALTQAAHRLSIYIMHGNRDFLMGKVCMQACQATLIDDPCVLVTPLQRYLLTHGDALCTGDTAYMEFRSQVRTKDWQYAFLSQPLEQRQKTATQMRLQSEARKQLAESFTDINSALALEWLEKNHAQHLIHGHTHQPAQHLLSTHHSRWVLSDWDLDSSPRRADVLRMTMSPTTTLQRLTLQEATKPSATAQN